MADYDYRSALQVAIEATAAAAALLIDEVCRPGGPRGAGGHCPADVEAERLIRERLVGAFPDWGFLGEETGRRDGAPGDPHVWSVDPDDGTASMLRGVRGHAVSIGLLRDGLPVLGVVRSVDAPDDDGDWFAWAEGCGPLIRNGQPVVREPWPTTLGTHDVLLVSQAADWSPAGNLQAIRPARFRSVASIAYRLALVAAGEGAVGVSASSPGSWDYAGGHALLRGAGGVLVNERGAPVTYDRDGTSQTARCFGGAPALVAELARRDWSQVSGSGFGDAMPPEDLKPCRLAKGRRVTDTGVLRRAQGCLLGQVAGDALGALVEFQPPGAIALEYPDGGPNRLADGGPFSIAAGQPTDDSELALMLARTLAGRSEFDVEAVARAYARWFHGWLHDPVTKRCGHTWCRPFDAGNATTQALSSVTPRNLVDGTAASTVAASANRESKANGALMRISPLGIWGALRDPLLVADAARADSGLTHPNLTCREASAVFAVTIAQAIREGTTPRATYEWAVGWAREHCRAPDVVDCLIRAEHSRPADFMHHAGFVEIAFQNAFFHLANPTTFETALVETVRSGGDSDTNAAICGALLGAVHGREGLPAQWRRMVVSCRPMPDSRQFRRPRPAALWPADVFELAELLLL